MTDHANLHIVIASFSTSEKRQGAIAAHLFFRYEQTKEVLATLRLAQPQPEVATNNRAALQALLMALGELNDKAPNKIHLYTASKYVGDSIPKLKSWAANGWKTRGKKDIAHADLWKQILKGLKGHTVRVHPYAKPAFTHVWSDCKTAANGARIRERWAKGSDQLKAERKPKANARKQQRAEWDKRRMQERRRLASDAGQKARPQQSSRASRTRPVGRQGKQPAMQAAPRHRASRIRTITR
jgi:ribonuclease HI